MLLPAALILTPMGTRPAMTGGTMFASAKCLILMRMGRVPAISPGTGSGAISPGTGSGTDDPDMPGRDAEGAVGRVNTNGRWHKT
jgi:hypothetical protein